MSVGKMGHLVESCCLFQTPHPGNECVPYTFLFLALINMFTSGKHTPKWIVDPHRIVYTCTYAYMCTYRCPCIHIQTLELNAKAFITTINFKDLEFRTRALNEPSASGKINLFSWWQLALAAEAYINGQFYLSQLCIKSLHQKKKELASEACSSVGRLPA